MNLYFDIGASNTRVGVSGESNTGFAETRIFPTLDNFDDFLFELKKTTDEITGGIPPAIAVGGIAGPLNRTKTGILSSYHSDWVGRPISEEFNKSLGCPVILENDAALAALGEARFGAGKNFGIVAYFTFSTGIGGARIVDGKIDRNAWGFEPRWQAAGVDHGRLVFLDDMISGHAISKKYEAKPEDIQDRTVWEEVEKMMAVSLLNGIGFWSPEVIIIGGSIGESHYISLDNLRQHVTEAMDYQTDVQFVKASLGQLNGLHGAMALTADLKTA